MMARLYSDFCRQLALPFPRLPYSEAIARYGSTNRICALGWSW